jgi:polyhydroxyalkanoate synthesis regulator phasin
VDRRFRRPVAIGVAALLAVAGAGAAVAATGGSDPGDAILNDAAQRLDVSPEKLSDALKGAFADQVDQAVKDGKLTQQQADRIKQHIQRGNGLPPFGPRFEMHVAPGGPHGDPKAAADYLGLTVDQLGVQLRDGKTLADVAKAQGKSVDGLKDAIVDAAKQKLDKAVADGDLTAKQRDRLLQGLQRHVDDLVNGKPPRFEHHGMRGWGPPPGGPGEPGPWGGPPPGP